MNISDVYKTKLIRWHWAADFFFNKFRFYGSRKLYRLLANFFLPKLDKQIFCPTIFGFDLVVGPENAYYYYYLGFYESGVLNIFENILLEDDVFIDVGANIGLMSFFSASLVGKKGKIIAIEPTQKYFDDLNNGIQKNRFSNIFPMKIGLGSVKNTLPIFHNSVCPSLLKTSDTDISELIEIEPLDEILERYGLKKVKLIKIDVEGFELEVVKGGKKLFSSPDAPVVCIEFVKTIQMLKENGMTSLDLLKQLNSSYLFFQLEKSSDTICQLVEIKNFENLHENDNVFCFLENQIHLYSHLIKN